MATDKDISSTEKLLNVIRNSPDADQPDKVPEETVSAQDRPVSSGRRKKIISLGAREVVGIEIHESRVSLVKMSQAGRTWKAVQAFSAYMKTGMDLDHPDFPDFLGKQLRRMEGIKKARLWATVPGFKGDIWHVMVPRVKTGLSNAVFWSAKKERAFDEKEVIFDYRVQGETTDNGAKKLLVEVYTAPKNQITALKNVFSRAGFTLEGITLCSYGLQNIFLNRWIDPGDQVFAVLNIDKDCSFIDIHHGNKMLLSRVIKTGLKSMAEAIVQEQKQETAGELVYGQQGSDSTAGAALGRDQALELLLGLEEVNAQAQDSEYPREKIFAGITPALERLSRQVERTMDHSINVLGNPATAKIHVCGRLAAVPRVLEYFQEQLGMDIQVLDTLNPSLPRVSPVISSMNKVQRMELVPSSGAAMSSNEYTPNFLYTAMDRDRQKIFKRNAGIAAAILVLALLLTGGYWLQSKQELHSSRKVVAGLQDELNSYSPRVSHEMITLLAGRFQEHSSILRDYSRKFIPAAAMSELTAITPNNVQLLNVRMDIGTSGAAGAEVQNRMMVVDGFIKGDEVLFETYLSSYLFKIRNSPLFGDTVIHKSSAESFGSEGQVLRFIINVNLRQV
ncbi:MAG: hypothetical protein ACOCV7_07785 [Desulfonatronovibrionaceae bacterium]